MLSSQTNYNLEKKKGNLINSISISFEFFPPKNEESITRLLSDINEFTTLNPSFISITCSPHKKTTNHTYKLIKKIKKVGLNKNLNLYYHRIILKKTLHPDAAHVLSPSYECVT